MLHYCVDDENDETASACGHLFSDAAAKKHLTREASKVECTNCIRWMKVRGILPGDRTRLARITVMFDEDDRKSLDAMAADAHVTRAELVRQLLRRAARERKELLEPGET
jgi:hypothetical protein